MELHYKLDYTDTRDYYWCNRLEAKGSTARLLARCKSGVKNYTQKKVSTCQAMPPSRYPSSPLDDLRWWHMLVPQRVSYGSLGSLCMPTHLCWANSACVGCSAGWHAGVELCNLQQDCIVFSPPTILCYRRVGKAQSTIKCLLWACWGTLKYLNLSKQKRLIFSTTFFDLYSV